MKYANVAALAGAMLVAVAGAAYAGDPESCKAVRFSDVGWTDITATTSIAAEIFKGLGYTPKVTVLSVPVTNDSLFGVSWSPDGKRVAFGCTDKSVRAIDAKTGAQVLFQQSHDDWVLGTAFSVDGTPETALAGAVGVAAADCLARAVIEAVIAADAVADIPTYRGLLPGAFEQRR